MSTELNKTAHCFAGFIENKPVVFFAVIHFPHPKVNNFKKGHRLVVLPDYQGLGIGHIFSSEIAQIYKSDGYRFIITSSTKSLFSQRQKDPKWIVTHKGRFSRPKGDLSSVTSENKMTFSYEYIGIKIKK
jgi:GNAT superfamily N-acetyltransferase